MVDEIFPVFLGNGPERRPPHRDRPVAVGTRIAHREVFSYYAQEQLGASMRSVREAERSLHLLAVGPQQFWIVSAHAGRRLGLWMDTTTVHLSLDGVHLKTGPSRQTTVS
jgi:hypothetical protein